jgi:hypothetical protein
MIAILELILIVIVIVRVWGQFWQVVIIGWVVPIVSVPLL